jgi:hypothetical protein
MQAVTARAQQALSLSEWHHFTGDTIIFMVFLWFSYGFPLVLLETLQLGEMNVNGNEVLGPDFLG